MTRSPEELAQIAFEIASEAAQVLYAGFRRHPAVREKGRADLVTEYDLASEQLIRKRLAERTPGLAIVGEEQGGAPALGDDLTWYCDPLDGTTSPPPSPPIGAAFAVGRPSGMESRAG